MWTSFWDMHSGGGAKEEWHYIYIEAPMVEAKVIFYNRFGHNPERVTCTCCGSDYSIDSHEDLAQLTGFHRGCKPLRFKGRKWQKLTAKQEKFLRKHSYYDEGDPIPEELEIDEEVSFEPYITLEDYIKTEGKGRASRLFIFAKDIEPEERLGGVPQQGYIWVD